MSNKRNQELESLIESMPEGEVKKYINFRVLPQMEYYSKKSAECKKNYYSLATISIIIGIFIPVLSLFADGSIHIKVALTLSGALITGINAYLNLFNFQMLWSNYRYCREELLSVLFHYFTKTGSFSSKDEPARNKALVDACEIIINNEKNDWKQIAKNNTDLNGSSTFRSTLQ